MVLLFVFVALVVDINCCGFLIGPFCRGNNMRTTATNFLIALNVKNTQLKAVWQGAGAAIATIPNQQPYTYIHTY